MPSHTFLSILHLCFFNTADIVHFHGVGNALFLPLLGLIGLRKKTLVVVDGPDWQRPKWGRLARLAFRASFPLAARLADEIISDNVPVQKLFHEEYGRGTHLVGYGADLEKPARWDALTKYGLEPSKYLLQVAAIVPDKGVHILVEAYEKLETDLPLVIVGDTPYMTEYKRKVQSTRDPRIRFLGYIYGVEYRELLANCYMYIHPLLVDGTSPALLQAMAYGCCVIGSDLPETGWTLADTGPKFRPGDVDGLREQMAATLDHPEKVREYGQKACQRIIDHFSWDYVTDQYEALSYQVLRGS